MAQKHPIFAKIAEKYSVDVEEVARVLKATAFKQKGDIEVTDAQMVALLVVADQYGLNPFTREIFAFPDKTGIVPVVGVDGWARIINDHPSYDGCEIRYSEKFVKPDVDAKEAPEWVEVSMYRKDRTHPTTVREYLDEVYKPRGAYKDGNKMPAGHWQTHTKRALRHKGFIQCARVAFGFGGIYDEDEAHRIVDAGVVAEIEDATKDLMPRAKPKAVTHNPGQTIEGIAKVVKPETVNTETGEISPADRVREAARDAVVNLGGTLTTPENAEPVGAGPLLQEGARKTLRAAMERAGRDEKWLADTFAVTVDTMPFSLFNDVMKALRTKATA